MRKKSMLIIRTDAGFRMQGETQEEDRIIKTLKDHPEEVAARVYEDNHFMVLRMMLVKSDIKPSSRETVPSGKD